MESPSWCRASLQSLIRRFRPLRPHAIRLTLAVVYNIYLVWAVWLAVSSGLPLDWCGGVGLLLIVTGIAYTGILYFRVVKVHLARQLEALYVRAEPKIQPIARLRCVRYGFYLAVLSALIAFLVVDTIGQHRRLISLLGLAAFVVVGLVFSKHPAKVQWRQVIWGLLLQFLFGLAVIRWPVGRQVFDCIGLRVTIFLNFTNAGADFVYGHLNSGHDADGHFIGTVFAFKALSVIYFFGFLVNVLYFYGVVQWMVRQLGWLLQLTVGSTAVESMNCAANIFLGQTEAPLLIQPYLHLLTVSELHAVMTGGYASISGTVLAAYISFGISASHLLSASVMSAPAALACSKLLYPETEESRTQADDIAVGERKEANALDAAAQGAVNGVVLVLHIIANMIAFLAFVAFLDAVVSWMAGLVGAPDITFQLLVAKLFVPVAWLMGVPSSECQLVADLIATKTIVNEFAAYAKLSQHVAAGAISKRSEAITTFALCGFSNVGSIGIQLAALSALAPQRKSDVARIAFRALVAGCMACFMTACVAGTLTDQ